MVSDARRRAEEALAEYDRLWGAAHATNAYGRAVVGLASAFRALLAAGPEAKTPVTTPVPWLECLTVISNPIVPQGAILIHPDTLAGKPDALAYRPPDPLPQPAPITPPPPSDAVREAVMAGAELLSAVRSARTGSIGSVDNTYLPQIGREWLRPIEKWIDAGVSALAASPSTVTAPDDAAVREAADAFTVYCDVCEADRREPCHTVTTGDPAPYPHPERAVAAKLAARGGE